MLSYPLMRLFLFSKFNLTIFFLIFDFLSVYNDLSKQISLFQIIDWHLAVVTLREADLQSIDVKLRSISLDKIDELEKQGEWLYKQYFESNEKIIKTMLAELNDRIFTYRAKSYFDWNMPTQRVVQNPLFLSRVAHKSQGFTAVILTYDRIESLFKLIQKLSVVMSLQKILVVWNNEKEAPPHSELKLNCELEKFEQF